MRWVGIFVNFLDLLLVLISACVCSCRSQTTALIAYLNSSASLAKQLPDCLLHLCLKLATYLATRDKLAPELVHGFYLPDATTYEAQVLETAEGFLAYLRAHASGADTSGLALRWDLFLA